MQAQDLFELTLEEVLNTRIDSVSGFAEKASEAPAPVTVINELMLKNSGVYSLRDLLTLYVPSFTQVQDQNEYNVSFRGIYTSSQQKFLVLLNGHRLNGRSYSMANPDHAIALEKVKRIEVIRGPGSSIYGNVALTNVVNIVTKTAQDSQGLSASVEVGNHGYQEYYLQLADDRPTFDYFSWFKFVRSKGEALTLRPQDDYAAVPYNQPVTIRLDAFNSEPSMDAGATFDFNNDWSLLLNYRQGHYREPLTTGGISGEAYAPGTMPEVHGVAPGAQSKWVHLSASKEWQVSNNTNFNLKTYYDTNHILGPLGINPQTGAFVDVAWREYDFGFNGKWLHTLDNGLLMAGIDYDQTKLKFSRALAGSQGQVNNELLFNGEPILRLGVESVASVYGQYKHTLSDKWLLNIGFRYDAKDRLTGPDIKELSPRAAAIYNDDNTTVKLSYARSFVDPPYWNRYSQFASFRGSSDLKPEILESFQLTPAYTLLEDKLHLKLNLYFNKYSDVVFRRTTALPEEPLFVNAGIVKSVGLEQEWMYRQGSTTFRLIGNHYKVKSAEGYGADEDEIFNIPRNQYNLLMDHELSATLSYQLAIKYLGNRRSPINVAQDNTPVPDPFPSEGVVYQDPNNREKQVVLFNANLRWKPASTSATMTFNVQNLFDNTWYQGGSVVHPYQQTGRWFKVGVEYRW